MPFWPDRFHVETVRSGTGAVPFDPMELTAMGEWWDIRTLAGLADSDPVGSWAGNKSLYTLTQTGTARPMYAADEGDGHPGVLFDGVDDSMGCVISNADLFGTTGDMEIWLVIRMPLVPVGGIFTSTGISNQIGLLGGSPNATLPLCNGSVSITFPTADMADNAWHVIRLMKSGARRVVAIDGQSVYDSTTSSGPYSTGADILNLGYYFGTYGQVRFRHFLAFTEVLSEQEALDLDTYLRTAL